MSDFFHSTTMANFTVALEEAARATEAGTAHFVEPAAGTLRRALSARHHLIFGRRGSGKTSLLQKARAELIQARRPNSLIDMEKFKKHSYPDVLISVLIETFSSMESWLDEGAVVPSTKTSFWRRLRPNRKPLEKNKASLLAEQLRGFVTELTALLHAQDDAEIEMLHRSRIRHASGAAAEVGAAVGPVTAGVSGSAEHERSHEGETKESVRRSKTDFLHRRVLDYQATLKEIVALSGEDGFVLLDDLYYMKRTDQPDVLDYFHRLFKGSGLWLKVGTIRHRSQWYRHGDPAVGMKLGDDVDEVDLDLTLEKYQTAKSFLFKIASELAQPFGISMGEVINEGARDRLVLASGGVARDYLSILRKSISIASEQGKINVDVAAVNQAAGEHESTKRDEFRIDVTDGENELEGEFNRIRDFCFKTGFNCFVVEKDLNNDTYRRIKELVDLRLVHAINSRITVRNRPGRIFEAYMLDLSQYAAERKRRNLQMLEFWKRDAQEKLRRTSLIYAESA